MEGPAPSPITRGSYLINTFIHQKFLPHHPDSFLIKFLLSCFMASGTKLTIHLVILNTGENIILILRHKDFCTFFFFCHFQKYVKDSGTNITCYLNKMYYQ